MGAEELIARLGIPAATFIVSLVSGFVPFVNAEIFLAGVTLAAPASGKLLILVLATLGQMTAKVVMYMAGRGILKMPRKLDGSRVEALRAKLEAKPNRLTLVTFVSASVGLPPFYIMAVLAGTLKLPWPRFVVCGLVGRAIRFAAVIYPVAFFSSR